MAGRTLTIDILTREAQSVAAQKRLQKELQTTSKDIDKANKSSLSLGSALGGLAVGAGLMKLSKDSQDLGRQQTATAAIFGASAEQINAFGEGAAEALGMSNAEALTAANTFGDMFTRLQIGQSDAAGMSTKMVELATQFAAVKGADPSSVIEGMSSAFRGEYDALQRYIPSITDASIKQAALAATGKDNEKSLTEQEKALAVYQLMVDSAGVSTDVFAKLQDSAAFKTQQAAAKAKDASAEFGQNLAPAVGAAADVVGFLSDGLTKLPAPLQTATIAGLGLAVVGPKIYSGMSSAASGVKSLVDGARSGAPALKNLAGAGAAVAAGVTAYNLTYKALERLNSTKNDTEALAAAVEYLGESGQGLSDVFTSLGGDGGPEKLAEQFHLAYNDINGISAILPGIIDGLSNANPLNLIGVHGGDTEIDQLRKAKEAVADLDAELAKAAQGNPAAAKKAYDELTAALVLQGVGYDEIDQLLPKYGAAIGTAASQTKIADQASEEHKNKLDEQAHSLFGVAKAASSTAVSVGGLVSAVERAAKPHRELNDAQTELADAMLSEAEAADAVKSAQGALADARDGVAAAIESQVQAQRGVGDAMQAEADAAKDVADAEADVVDKTEELAQAQREAAGDSDAMRNALRGVTSAQEDLTAAQENTADAQRALDQATADYSDTLAQLQQDAAGAADDVLSAEIRLRKAQAELANLGKPDANGKVDPVSADDRLAAEIAVREAERRLADARRAAAEAAQNVDANNDGAAASEAVVAASQDVEDAKRDEAAAQQALGDAVQNVADTQVAANAAVQTAEENLQTAIEGVSEAQRKRVEAHQSVLDAQANVAKAAQGVRDAEAEVRDRLGEVAKAQGELNTAADATVTAQGKVESASGRLGKKVQEHADAEAAVAANAALAATALRTLFTPAMADALGQFNPNDPRVQIMMALFGITPPAGYVVGGQHAPPVKDSGSLFGGKKNEYNSTAGVGKPNTDPAFMAAQNSLLVAAILHMIAGDYDQFIAALTRLFGGKPGGAQSNVGPMGTSKGGGIFDGAKDQYNAHGPAGKGDQSAEQLMLRRQVEEYIAAAGGPGEQAKRAAAVAAFFAQGQGAKADVVELTASTVNVGGMGATTKGGGIFEGTKGPVAADHWPTLLADTKTVISLLRDLVRVSGKPPAVQVVGGDPLSALAGAVGARGRR